MPNVRRIITGPVMKFELSPELTSLVQAMAKTNKETPGELLQKALGMYDGALAAKLKGLHVGVTGKADNLDQVWLF